MKIADLQVNQVYTRGDASLTYIVQVNKVNEYAIVLVYSTAHYIAHLKFLTQSELDEDYNKNLRMEEDDYYKSFFENDLMCIDENYLKDKP